MPSAVIFGLGPNTAVEGSSSFTLGVFGSGFEPGDTVQWNTTTNGTTNTTNLVTTFVSSGQLAATVPASLLTEESSFGHGFQSVTVFQNGTTSNAVPFTITDAPLSADGGSIFFGHAGEFLTRTVATFTDTGGPEPLGDYSASINWGDSTSSTGVITDPSNGVYTVTGYHTYATKGAFSISVTIFHETASPVTVFDTADIDTSTIIVGPTITSLSPNTAVEGSGSFTLFVFGSNFVPGATVQWSSPTSGTTSLATTFDSSSELTATVPASLLTEESNSVHGMPSITVSQNGLTSNALPFTIIEAPLFGTGGFTISGVEGQALNNVTVATFTGTANQATINWGDGTTTAGSISGSAVTGSHTYTEESNDVHGGPFTITVTISNGTAVTVTDTANIAEAPLSDTGGFTISAVGGQAFTATVATFTDTGGPENFADPGDYSASIDWGDSTTSAGTISAPTDGVFTVTGGHTYAGAGSFTITVTLTHETAPTVTVTDTATGTDGVLDLPLAGAGMDITATQFVAQDQMVAQFTDPDPNAQVGDYTALIDWGDGTPVDTGTITQPGGPGAPFFVDFTHAYNDVGPFTIHVNITDNGGASDGGGASIDLYSTATVTSPSAPHAPGRGSSGPGRGIILPVDAVLLGDRPLLGATAVQGSTGQRLQAGAIMASPSTASAVPLAQASTSVQSSQSSADTYWQILSQVRGDRITDPTGWVADQLALALQGTTR